MKRVSIFRKNLTDPYVKPKISVTFQQKSEGAGFSGGGFGEARR
jgi:hypothetical protein